MVCDGCVLQHWVLCRPNLYLKTMMSAIWGSGEGGIGVCGLLKDISFASLGDVRLSADTQQNRRSGVQHALVSAGLAAMLLATSALSTTDFVKEMEGLGLADRLGPPWQ